ncbi:hypothetical protein TSAR_005417 [Trichomalopsis sarcophagae]|uniref:Proteasome alpha-type subunits domain-containing protein n=1 Tax=Trichomalopsis sarcophagae TaxID=543379 RepID=A0A232ESV5_9HYME|nr:hypothetical protein TSAR_005417 [Trichomalopsis sarcophagae]
MSSIGTGYDLSASQFSPDGRVFQVEYAQKAVENSGSSTPISTVKMMSMQVHSSHEFGNQSDLKRLWDRNKAKHCIFCHPFHKDVLILMSQLNTDKSVYLCCRLKNYLHILTSKSFSLEKDTTCIQKMLA